LVATPVTPKRVPPLSLSPSVSDLFPGRSCDGRQDRAVFVEDGDLSR
jgi:hypothetical protein